MYTVHGLSGQYWPGREIARDLFEHFSSLVESNGWMQHASMELSGCRAGLFSLLEQNHHFSRFWKLVQEMYPEKENYFASLVDQAKPYKPEWLVKRYNKFRFKKVFEEMSRTEKRNLKIEFESFRLDTYHFALKTEAQRLNCDLSDVRPQSPVLPLEPGYDPKFILAALPDEILVKTLHHLDSVDVFRMTLVCKGWKNLVHNNCEELKRAEHAVTTHLITFTDWMEPAKTPSGFTFVRQYSHFSWGLVRWCCGISSNLETLILDHSVSYSNVATLLKSCPNLKNFQLDSNSDYGGFRPSGLLPEKLLLPKLEVYLCSRKGIGLESHPLKRDVLCSTKKLRVLRESILDEDVENIQFVRPLPDLFRHLIALDLNQFSCSVLEVLVSIPKLQLKYLGLGFCTTQCAPQVETNDNLTLRYRELFHQLVSKLRELEVLIAVPARGVTNETIQLLIDLDLNLQFAVFAHSFVRPGSFRRFNMGRMPVDPLDPNLLTEFRDRLLLRNPELDLSDFHFIVEEPEERDQLLAADIGFTFTNQRSYFFQNRKPSGLCDPEMRNRLNINF